MLTRTVLIGLLGSMASLPANAQPQLSCNSPWGFKLPPIFWPSHHVELFPAKGMHPERVEMRHFWHRWEGLAHSRESILPGVRDDLTGWDEPALAFNATSSQGWALTATDYLGPRLSDRNDHRIDLYNLLPGDSLDGLSRRCATLKVGAKATHLRTLTPDLALAALAPNRLILLGNPKGSSGIAILAETDKRHAKPILEIAVDPAGPSSHAARFATLGEDGLLVLSEVDLTKNAFSPWTACFKVPGTPSSVRWQKHGLTVTTQEGKLLFLALVEGMGIPSLKPYGNPWNIALSNLVNTEKGMWNIALSNLANDGKGVCTSHEWIGNGMCLLGFDDGTLVLVQSGPEGLNVLGCIRDPGVMGVDQIVRAGAFVVVSGRNDASFYRLDPQGRLIYAAGMHEQVTKPNFPDINSPDLNPKTRLARTHLKAPHAFYYVSAMPDTDPSYQTFLVTQSGGSFRLVSLPKAVEATLQIIGSPNSDF